MHSQKVRNILAVSLIKGVGSAFMKKNLPLLLAYSDNLTMLSNIGGKVTLSEIESNLLYAQKIIDDCGKYNIEILTIIDKDYPATLLQIKDPPAILYLKGNKKLLNSAIAIIGTRKSTELGNKIASKIGKNFSTKWSICNGLVDGIDKNSIIYENQVLPRVIGILSGGLAYEMTSSLVTKKLAKLVLENHGLLVSENEPLKKEDQFSGSKASRIQAGLALGMILIQSSINGGSKYTIKAFSELNRPLGIVEFKKDKEYLSGFFEANRLILEKQNLGIAEFCDIKKIEAIRTNKIIRISGINDYPQFEKEITVGNPALP